MNQAIEKIQKLLALSKSSNSNEAQSAMLMAQRLMIKYKISQKDVEEHSQEDINIQDYHTNETFRGTSWKANLAAVIADNFCCYNYLRGYKYNVEKICFYGKDEDVTICKIMFEYAVKCINSTAAKIIREMKKDRRRKHFDGVKNDYAIGFTFGLQNRFKNQLAENEEWGLILKKDQEVTKKFTEFSNNHKFEYIAVCSDFGRHAAAYNKGFEDGKLFDISDKIEREGEVKYLI